MNRNVDFGNMPSQQFSIAMSQIPANYCADNVLAPLFPEHMGIGMNIRRARKHAGLTQEQLADRAAVQQSDVSKW